MQMMHRTINLRQLHTFVAIAEAGGFASAQDRLAISQPAASRQIQALEAELGVMLFDRIGRRIRMTSEGEDLLRRSRRLLEDVEAFSERVRALKAGETGTLRVGASTQHIETVLASFLPRYRQTGLWSWLTTVDHKRIGILYGATAFLFFLLGGVEALIIRLQLMKPNNTLVSPDTYNQLFTMHGTTMIFLVVMPLGVTFLNYLIPCSSARGTSPSPG